MIAEQGQVLSTGILQPRMQRAVKSQCKALAPVEKAGVNLGAGDLTSGGRASLSKLEPVSLVAIDESTVYCGRLDTRGTITSGSSGSWLNSAGVWIKE